MIPNKPPTFSILARLLLLSHVNFNVTASGFPPFFTLVLTLKRENDRSTPGVPGEKTLEVRMGLTSISPPRVDSQGFDPCHSRGKRD